MSLVAIGAPEAGLVFEEHVSLMISTSAVTKGDVVLIDESVYDSEFVGFNTVIQPTSTTDRELENGIFGVALDDISAGAIGRIGFAGRFECLVNGAVSQGEGLAPVAGQDYLDQPAPAVAAISKHVARTLVSGTGGLRLCWFNGIVGMGYTTGSVD